MLTMIKCLGGCKWFQYSVAPLVFLYIAFPCERLVTFVADKKLLSCASSFMDLQEGILVKYLVTIGAGKWLLTRVGLFIYLQTASFCECLVTFGAG